MYILGINISHHCSICLMKDGEIVFFIEEERLSKKKAHCPKTLLEDYWNDNKLKNSNSIQEIIRLTSMKEVIGHVKRIDHVIFSCFGNWTDVSTTNYLIQIIIDQIKEICSIGKIHFYPEHHLYHACSAFYHSGFDMALAIILDAGGFNDLGSRNLEFLEAESIYLADYNNFRPIFKNYIFAGQEDRSWEEKSLIIVDNIKVFSDSYSCGKIFNILSKEFGFIGEAGKTMGLAPYGDDSQITEKWFRLDESFNIWITDNEAIWSSIKRLSSFDRNLDFTEKQNNEMTGYQNMAANLAKKAQKETLEHTSRLIEKFTNETGEKNVVLSGGYFLNCTNNYEYLKRFPHLNFFVDPIAHDGGTAIGAAKYLWHNITGDTTVRKLKTLYLGNS